MAHPEHGEWFYVDAHRQHLQRRCLVRLAHAAAAMGTAAGRSVFYARLGPDATTTTVLTCLAYRPNERLPWHAHEQRPQVDWLSGIASLCKCRRFSLSRAQNRGSAPCVQESDELMAGPCKESSAQLAACGARMGPKRKAKTTTATTATAATTTTTTTTTTPTTATACKALGRSRPCSAARHDGRRCHVPHRVMLTLA